MKTIIVGGEEIQVMYIGVGSFENRLKGQIYYGEKGIGEMAILLDNNEGIEYHDNDKVETFIGYSHLTRIEYVDNETMVVFLDYVEPEPQPEQEPEPEPTPEPEEAENEPEPVETEPEGSEE